MASTVETAQIGVVRTVATMLLQMGLDVSVTARALMLTDANLDGPVRNVIQVHGYLHCVSKNDTDVVTH